MTWQPHNACSERVAINAQRCLRSRGINCTHCLQVCPMHVIGLRDQLAVALKPEKCIACHCCKGSCPAGLETIQVEDLQCQDKSQALELLRTTPALKIRLCTLNLNSPLILASGPIGRCAQGLLQATASGCGAVVTKTVTVEPRNGNPSIRIFPYRQRSIVNCEGVPNVGIHAMVDERALLIGEAIGQTEDAILVGDEIGGEGALSPSVLETDVQAEVVVAAAAGVREWSPRVTCAVVHS